MLLPMLIVQGFVGRPLTNQSLRLAASAPNVTSLLLLAHVQRVVVAII